MSFRDGVLPPARYLIDEDLDELELERSIGDRGGGVENGFRLADETLTVIGAPPWNVKAGVPGAWADVHDYVFRVDRAADRLQEAFAAWATARFGDDVKDPRAPSAMELTFLRTWPAWYTLQWKAWTVRANDPLNVIDSAESVWDKTLVYEGELETYRKSFATFATPPPPPPDGGYENVGGVKQPGIGDGLGDLVKKGLEPLETPLIIAAVAVVVIGAALIFGVGK